MEKPERIFGQLNCCKKKKKKNEEEEQQQKKEEQKKILKAKQINFKWL